MPTASDELRAKFPDWDREALTVLDDAGYRLDTETWTWTKPSPSHVPTEREIDAIDYLIGEFDYGGLNP